MRILQVAAAALVLSAAIAGQSQARTVIADRDVSSEQIVMSHVDWRDPVAVKAAYRRLQQAAMFVCGVGEGSNGAADRACADKALRDAVNQANRPLLTATYQQAGAPLLARGY